MYVTDNLRRFMVKQADGRQVQDYQRQQKQIKIQEFLSDRLKRWGGLSSRPHNKPWTPAQLSNAFRSSDIARLMSDQGMRVNAKEVAAVKQTMTEFGNPSKPTLEALVKKEVLGEKAKLYQTIKDWDIGRNRRAAALRGKGTAIGTRPMPSGSVVSKAVPYAKVIAAPILPLLAAGAVNDTWEHWTPENFAYGASSLNPYGENFNMKPWLETARTAAGLSEATPDMFDEAGSSAFWKALPGEILDSGLHTGAEMGKSIGRFGRDAGTALADAISRQGEEAKLNRPPQSALSDQIGKTKAYH